MNAILEGSDKYRTVTVNKSSQTPNDGIRPECNIISTQQATLSHLILPFSLASLFDRAFLHLLHV
jgi:hypothetical protein